MSEAPVLDPHAGQPVLFSGEPLERARAAMLLVHGRGANAVDILSLADELGVPGFAYLAPQAVGGTWYPQRFLAPLEANQPWLDSALASLDRVVETIEVAGLPLERTMLLGFSQGACLSLEYAARSGSSFGGVIGFSGGLIGPRIEIERYSRFLDEVLVFLGCSDVDPHIPRSRVLETAETLKKLGARVVMKLYPGMGHTVNSDELDVARRYMKDVLAP